ncbi:MAG: hypothetical protein AAFV93_01250 [Chloroflexota bacterium]
MRFLSCIVVVITFFATIAPASAQDISLAVPITATLNSDTSNSYTFLAREGQLISFVARAVNDVDVMLSVENLNGDIIASNDDYAYPDSRDAIIEAFVAPYTGSYTLIVESYGSTSGDYTLEMLAGYSTLSMQTAFDAEGDWQAVGTDLIDVPTLNVVNGTANLVQSGIDRIGIGVGVSVTSDVYYVRTTLDSITDTAGWRAGIVFGYQDELNFHRAVINYRGAWRMVAVRNGEETVLRDWNVHPAIVPDKRDFTVGVLVNQTSFDVFYDDQYVGTGTDSNFSAGQVGLVAETVSAIGSEVTVRFDDLTITEPTFVDESPIFPTMLVANGTNSTVRELQQRLLIPPVGEMAFTLNESFAQNNQAGVSRFAIGDGRTVTNFVVSARVSWVASQADLNGCGLVVRDDGNENYVLAYVDSEGGYGISERSGATFIQNSFNMRNDLQRPPHNMLLIVRDDVIHYYVNGNHALTLTIGSREGSIGEAVINFDAVNTNCQFNNLWVWTWQ